MGKDKGKKKDKKGQGDAPEAEVAPVLTSIAPQEAGWDDKPKMKKKEYEAELEKLQVELVKLQEWVKATNAKVCVLFEGRDAAGKGGIIKAITERTSPRVFRVVALAIADRARKDPDVLPALHAAPAGRRRGRAVRPQLVQPGGRRAGHGLRHRRTGRRPS